jgi:Fe-S cluster biogenesis protein NfuA/nitrite reductase/ring-hydroxylating ferredoxin subunit
MAIGEHATANVDLRRVGDRIETLLAEVRDGDPAAADRAEELVGLLMEFYGSGLRRLLAIVDEGGALGPDVLDRLVDDQLVASLLILHRLHPLPVEARVQRALDGVRPYLGSHGGDVEIVAIEGDAVRVRMGGTCQGCASSAVTLRYAIEDAILAAAPEIARVDAEAEAADDVAAGGGPQLIQLEPRRRPGAGVPEPSAGASPAPRWATIDAHDAPARIGVAGVEVGGEHVVLCRPGDDDALFAYRDRCPGCGASLAAAAVLASTLACASCGRAFDVRLAGRATDGGDLHLDPLPLLADDGRIRVAVATGLPV